MGDNFRMVTSVRSKGWTPEVTTRLSRYGSLREDPWTSIFCAILVSTISKVGEGMLCPL